MRRIHLVGERLKLRKSMIRNTSRSAFNYRRVRRNAKPLLHNIVNDELDKLKTFPVYFVIVNVIKRVHKIRINGVAAVYLTNQLNSISPV
jgi:hypothetical protein